jgi:periplasmic divalent cation tolerance protein
MSDYCMILNTCPNRESGELIASLLVERRLAACVNLVDNITSIYRWQDGIERDSETLLLIKAEQGSYPKIEETIREHHPYEVPEIICLEIAQGAEGYLNWISAATRQPPPTTLEPCT